MSAVASPKTAKPTKATGERPKFKVLAFDLLAQGKRAEAEQLAELGRKEIMLAEDEMPA